MTRVVVIGAGVFGAWTALRLLERGAEVTLIEAHAPAHARASSGGETRIIRTAYGKDELYARMAADSLPHWQALAEASDLPLFIPAGVLFFFPDDQPYLRDSAAAHRRLGLDSALIDRHEMLRRFPMFDFTGVELGLYEPRFGALLARRAVQTLVSRFVQAGGTYVHAVAEPPDSGDGVLDSIALAHGSRLGADRFVFAVGPWLPKLFPDAIGRRIRPTRQEVFYFAAPAGDPDFSVGRMPVWADFNAGEMYYGMPDIAGRGVKFARDAHGPEVDPDTQDRRPTDCALAEVIAYRDRRFPRLRGAPLTGAEVCQYENSSSGDFLIDFHPHLRNVLLVGGGSGHGFKHGPAVGKYAADLVLGGARSEPRFSLSAKSEIHRREVH